MKKKILLFVGSIAIVSGAFFTAQYIIDKHREAIDNSKTSYDKALLIISNVK